MRRNTEERADRRRKSKGWGETQRRKLTGEERGVEDEEKHRGESRQEKKEE